MASFRLDDLSTDAVRILAREMGIPNSQNADKDALIPQIVAGMGGNASLAFVPMNPTLDRPGFPKKFIRFLLAAAPLAIVALTAWIAWANWQAATTAASALQQELVKAGKQDREKRDYEWQRNAVYDIIDRGVKQDLSALTFPDIQNQYVSKAAARREELGKEKLNDQELQRILLDLTSIDLVYRTVDDRYYTKRHMVLKGDNSLTNNSTANAILRVLASERGTKTVDELRAIVTQGGTVSADEYNFVLAAMMGPGMGMVKVENGMVHAIPYPPSGNKK